MKRAQGLVHLDLVCSVLLQAALVVACFAAGMFYEGRRIHGLAAQEIADMAQRTARQVAWVRDTAADQQRGLQAAFARLQQQLLTEQGKANAQHQNHLAGVRAGTVRVRVPVVPDSCPAQSQQLRTAAAAGAEPAATHAQLEPATAAELADIAHDGDAAIRELNACIDQYRAVEKTWEQWRHTLRTLDDDYAQTP